MCKDIYETRSFLFKADDGMRDGTVTGVQTCALPICSSASVPQDAPELGPIARDAGVDIFVMQSTVISTKHKSSTSKSIDIKEFCNMMKVPVLVGNCVTYEVALTLMGTGVSGVLVGIGPGAACTSRGVLGVGVPMATAIADCAGARDAYFKENNVYVPIKIGRA